MVVQPPRPYGEFMRRRLALAALANLVLALPAPASPSSVVKIDTVPSEYEPINSPTNREPVSLAGFHFEINRESGRARIVADYTYPDQLIYGPDDPTRGPQSTIAQIPGLIYDPAAHEIVFEANGTRAVCAKVEEHHGLFGHRFKIRNTGACIVTARISAHVEDDGWDIRRFLELDTYFEVR